MVDPTNLGLYAGIPVTDFHAAVQWYERLLGSPPTFFATDTEAVWMLAEHRAVYVVQLPEHAGHAMLMLMVADLDALDAQLRSRGLEAVARETHDGGARKFTYRDPDGNEFSFGGMPQ